LERIKIDLGKAYCLRVDNLIHIPKSVAKRCETKHFFVKYANETREIKIPEGSIVLIPSNEVGKQILFEQVKRDYLND